jgi:hypothetical protein
MMLRRHLQHSTPAQKDEKVASSAVLLSCLSTAAAATCDICTACPAIALAVAEDSCPLQVLATGLPSSKGVP